MNAFMRRASAKYGGEQIGDTKAEQSNGHACTDVMVQGKGEPQISEQEGDDDGCCEDLAKRHTRT